MKRIKLLLLFVGLSYSWVAKAQENVLPVKAAEIKQPVSALEALSNSVNAKYMVLKSPTAVYRQLADTIDGRQARKLFPGTKVYIRKYLPEGFLINLGFAGDKLYYLPAKSAIGLQTFVEI